MGRALSARLPTGWRPSGPSRGTLRPRPPAPRPRRSGWRRSRPTSRPPTGPFSSSSRTCRPRLGQAPQAQEKLSRLAEETQGLMADLRDLGPGTVALYTLVGATRLPRDPHHPGGATRPRGPIAAADLARKVWAFRQALEAVRRRRAPARPPPPGAANCISSWWRPSRGSPRRPRRQTLMWSLDGVLRYLPLAALHDGEQLPARTLPPGRSSPPPAPRAQRPAAAPVAGRRARGLESPRGVSGAARGPRRVARRSSVIPRSHPDGRAPRHHPAR